MGFEWSTHQESATITQNGKKVTFHNVLWVPTTPENLLSGQVLVSRIIFPIIYDGYPRLDYQGNTVLDITLVGGKQMIFTSEETALVAAQGLVVDWHLRFEHLPFPAFKYIPEAPLARQYIQILYTTCQKIHQSQKSANEYRAATTLNTVHSDLCGPMETKGSNSQRYICTLIDKHSWFTLLRSIPSKVNVTTALVEMITAMEIQSGKKVKSIKTDNGGEY